MRAFIAALLSLVTLFGGHCLNRRWDRVVLFAGLGLLLGGLAWGAMVAGLSGDQSIGGIESNLALYHRVFMVVLSLLLAASALVSYRDARRPREATGHVAPLLAGIVLSLFAAYVVVTTVGMAMVLQEPNRTPDGDAAMVGSDSDFGSTTDFFHSIRLGGDWPHSETESVPSGKAELQGRVVYLGEPQSGVRLRLILNGRYETEVLETNDDGVFSVAVPSGEWRINKVRTQAWKSKPDDRSYSVITGHEPRYDLPYHRDFTVDRELPSVQLPDDPGPHLNLTIRRAVEMEWPGPAGDPVEADLDSDALEWNDPSPATRYVIKIPRVEKQGDTTHYRDAAYATAIDTTRLPLSELPTAEAPGETHRYAVRIEAFDEDGRLVNYTVQGMRDAGFSLMGTKIVDNSDWVREDSESATTAAQPDWKARDEARERLEVASTLIDEQMHTAAEELLGRVTNEHAPPGRLAVMKGYLAASRGRCDEARARFEKALRDNPDVCIVSCRLAECPELEELVE